MYKKVAGYEYEESCDGPKGLTIYRKHLPPSDRAIELSLKLSGEFVEKKEIEISSLPDLTNKSVEDLANLHEKLNNTKGIRQI